MTTLQTKLEAYYHTHLLQNDPITNFTPISDGWETEVYSFTIQGSTNTSDYILRMYPGEFAAEKCIKEFNGIHQLHTAGYPVPQVYHHSTDAGVLGKAFIIMEKIQGKPLGHLMLNATPEDAPYFTTQFCQLLVDLHTLDVTPFLPADINIPDDPFYFVRSKLEAGKQTVQYMGAVELLPMLAWLEAQIELIPCSRPSVVHNDFHPFNVLRTNSQHAYVIDWGNIEVTDYRFDLAGTIMLCSTFGQPHRHDEILNEYERIIGQSVPHIEIFEAYWMARRLFEMVISVRMGPEKLGMRPEAVSAMKSQRPHFEAVYEGLTNRSGLRIPEIEAIINHL